MPAKFKAQLQRGDVLTLVGRPEEVQKAAEEIGFPDRRTETTDMLFLGFGVAFGCFIGAISIHFGGVPVSLSSSGGTLLSGLFLGWLRNRHPTFGRIPGPVIWLFDKLGLNMFIAVIGLTSGATFAHALREYGFTLFVAGVICTLVTLTVNIFIARKLFHFNATETRAVWLARAVAWLPLAQFRTRGKQPVRAWIQRDLRCGQSGSCFFKPPGACFCIATEYLGVYPLHE